MSPQVTRRPPALNVVAAVREAYFKSKAMGKFTDATPDRDAMCYGVGFRDGCAWLMFAGSVLAPYIKEFIDLLVQIGYQEVEPKRCPHCGLLP